LRGRKGLLNSSEGHREMPDLLVGEPLLIGLNHIGTIECLGVLDRCGLWPIAKSGCLVVGIGNDAYLVVL